MKVLLLLNVVVFAALARRHAIPVMLRPLRPQISYARICNDTPSDIILYNSTIQNTATDVLVSLSGGITRDVDIISQTVVTIRRCNSPQDEYSCELFHTWRFGKETCGMIEMKRQSWSSFFASIHPPAKCPIKKGDYNVVNATLDVKSVQAIFKAYPIEKYFWRVRVEPYDDRQIGCAAFAVSFVR